MDNALPQFAELKDFKEAALLCFVAGPRVGDEMSLCKVVKPSLVPSAPVYLNFLLQLVFSRFFKTSYQPKAFSILIFQYQLTVE